jgi:hypothetical protein
MKKYISIFVVALVALFATTSCQLSSGTDPNPNRANNLLWSRTQEALSGQYEHILAIAQLNDTLRDAEYGNKPYDGYNPDITEKDGIYKLSYGYQRTYIVNTTGKKLEDGGEWTIKVKYGTYMEPYKLGTVKGVVGEPTKFSIDFEDLYAYRASYSSALKADIEYYYNESEECLDITFATAEGYSVEQYETTPDYIVEFKATHPLVYYGGVLYSGEVDILYKDNILNRQRGVTVEIFNKFATFVPLKGSDL